MVRFKAEMVLAFTLAIRHRAVQGAALLALGLTGPLAARSASSRDACRLMLLAVTVTTATAASRSLAPGAAVAAARRVSTPWVAVTGRLAGVTVVGVGSALASLAVTSVGGGVRALGAAVLYAMGLGAVCLALAPRVGASAAAALGLAAAVGLSEPSWASGSRAAGAMFAVRHTLPLPWRGVAWFEGGGVRHLLVLAAWVALGLVLAAVAIRRLRVRRA